MLDTRTVQSETYKPEQDYGNQVIGFDRRACEVPHKVVARRDGYHSGFEALLL